MDWWILYQIAIDGLGNVWVTNPTGDLLSEFSNSGTAISGSSGYTGGGLSSPEASPLTARVMFGLLTPPQIKLLSLSVLPLLW